MAAIQYDRDSSAQDVLNASCARVSAYIATHHPDAVLPSIAKSTPSSVDPDGDSCKGLVGYHTLSKPCGTGSRRILGDVGGGQSHSLLPAPANVDCAVTLDENVSVVNLPFSAKANLKATLRSRQLAAANARTSLPVSQHAMPRIAPSAGPTARSVLHSKKHKPLQRPVSCERVDLSGVEQQPKPGSGLALRSDGLFADQVRQASSRDSLDLMLFPWGSLNVCWRLACFLLQVIGAMLCIT